MCHFIYVILPKATPLHLLRPILEPLGTKLRPAPPDRFGPLPGDAFFATDRYCDCGTVLGCRLRGHCEHDASTGTLPEDAERLRRKGWTEARIARWIEEKNRGAENRTRHLEALGESQPQQVLVWQRLIKGALLTGTLPWFGLVYHWHVGEEPVALSRIEPVSLDQLTDDHLMTMEENVLYQFCADSRQA